MTEKHDVKSRIPDFASREEEAKFWDTHDTTDFEDEFKPVRVRVAEDLAHVIQIELDSETFRALCALARKKGESPIIMVKGWILERLKEEEG